jgi:hypothetical protein
VRRRRMDKDAVPDDLFARVLRRLFGVDSRTGTQAAEE